MTNASTLTRTMKSAHRAQFDHMLEQIIADLPADIRQRIESVPVIVDDAPTAALSAELELPADELLCGLHVGVPLTERSIDDPPTEPDLVYLFRAAIVELAGGWDQPDAHARIAAEIRITLLHELGHHFGLDETDLTNLGYD